MGTPPRAAIYTRISKDREGRELGVQRQEADCRALATRLGYEQVTVFQDNDISASTLSTKLRPGFIRMMEQADAGDFDAIIAYSNSRLTRRVVELQTIIDITKRRGIRIHTVASGQHDLDTADGKAAMLTIAVWDQAEAERTGERIQRQKRQRAEDGHWHGGAAPYGYRAGNKVLVVDDHEAERIHEAARRILDFNEPLHSIAKDWNDSGVTTRGGHHWRQSNLRSILTNPSLLGVTKAGVKGWDAILDQRTFDRLQAHFSDASRKVVHSPGVKGGKYTMGGGLTVCAKCGKPLTSQVRHGSRSPSLICNRQVQGPDPVNHPQVERTVRGKVVKQDTGRVRIDHDSLETYVIGQLTDALNDSDRWRQRLSESNPDAEVEVLALEAQRGELKDERLRAQRAFVAGIMTEAESKREVDRVDAELAAIQSEINRLLDKPALSEFISGGIDWAGMSPAQRRAALRIFIDRIEVGEWPEGVSRNPIRKRGESDEAYSQRQREHRTMALDKRINIVWKWANQI